MSKRRFRIMAAAVGTAALLLAGCSASVSVGTPDASTGTDELLLAFDGPALAEEIGSTIGKTVTVDCPAEIPLQQGLVTDCTVTDGIYTNALTITQTDDQGNITWRIGDVISGPSDGASASADTDATESSGLLPPVTTADEFTALFMTDAQVDAVLPNQKMQLDWSDGQQGPTSWASGNRVEPSQCQIVHDFGLLGAGTVPDGPFAWVGAKGWKAEKTNKNGAGQSVTETIGVYTNETTARAAYDAIAAVAERCTTYRFPDRTDVKKFTFGHIEMSTDPQMIMWTVNSPDDGKLAWLGAAMWIGDRVVYLEAGIVFRDDETMMGQFPVLMETALTQATG